MSEPGGPAAGSAGAGPPDHGWPAPDGNHADPAAPAPGEAADGWPAPDVPGGELGELGEPLDPFKAGPDQADNETVHDAIGGRPRLNWSPVTDGGNRAATDPPEQPSGFHFDLGGALARLGAPDHPETPVAGDGRAPLAPPDQDRTGPRPGPPTDFVAPARPATPEPAPPSPERLDPLPRRGERPAPAPTPSPAPIPTADGIAGPQVAARRSVFDDGSARPGVSPPGAPVAPATPVTPTVPGSMSTGAPVLPPVGAPVLLPAGAPVLPTLPAPKPLGTPVHTPATETVPTAPDITALRSAQLRANRQQRNGKLFGRTLFVLLAIGGLIAAGLVFGRQYLFPTEWDPLLTPIVDDIQTERGVEFDHAVGLVQQPEGDYALTVGRLAIDDAWVERVPEWRALGLAAGEPSIDTIAPALAARRVAIYDPETDRIYMSAAVDPAAAAADLRLAVEQAFGAQIGRTTAASGTPLAGLAGVSSLQLIADRAVQTYVAERTAAEQGEIPAVAPGAPPATAEALPVPIEYELTAIDQLGAALLAAAGLDPATVTFESGYPDTIATALDDAPRPTASAVLQTGDRSLAAPVALGVDDWTLAWAARLPAVTVEGLARVVVGDSYRPVDRAGVTCVVAAFEAASAPDAAFVLSALQSWVAAAPPTAQATVTPSGETRVQLVTCDPGAEAAVSPQPGVADALVDRQLVRLGG